jgi:hypothetical protein
MSTPQIRVSCIPSSITLPNSTNYFAPFPAYAIPQPRYAILDLHLQINSHKLILDPRNNNSLPPLSLHLRLHLQTNPLHNRRFPPLHLHLRPPRPPLRHRPHRRNVLLRSRYMGLSTTPNSPGSLLRGIRRCCALGTRSHWIGALGVCKCNDWSRSLRGSPETGRMEEGARR